MPTFLFTILVLIAQFTAFASAASAPVRIYDVLGVRCESGVQPDTESVFQRGAVLQMSEDAVNAFARENSNRDSVILRYPIPEDVEELETPPPCPGRDVLIIQLKRKN